VTGVVRRAGGYLGGLAVLAALIGLWQALASAHPVFFLPTPAKIWHQVRIGWLSGPASHAFLSHDAQAAIGQTFENALLGWLIAACLGVLAGALLGALPTARDYAGAPLLFLRSIPPIAVIPLCIVVLGLGTGMHLTVIVFGCLWPVLLNTLSGVADIEPVQIDVARLNHLGPVARLLRVLLPAASPKIFAGLRVATSIAIVLSVASEMFAGTGGLGGAAIVAQSTFDVTALWAALTVLAFFGVLVNLLFVGVERTALRWHVLRSKQ
jgi:ABC-type nitrate/sulfonate/bicarbonate transport system permease component